MANKGVLHRSIHSGKWFVVGFVIQKFFNLASFLVLARLLMPEDFGMLGVVLIVIGLVDSFSTPGFTAALLQKKEGEHEYLDTVWTLDLLRAIFLALVIYLFSTPIASFFNFTSGNFYLIKYSGLLLIIAFLANSYSIYFFKNFFYEKVVIRDTVSQLVYFFVALALVIGGQRDVGALFIATFARYFASTITTYIVFPRWPIFSFAFYKLKDLFNYAKWVYAQNLIDFFLAKIDSILVVRFLSVEQLGYYSRAKELPGIFSGAFISLFNKIGLVAYVKVQDEMKKVQEGFLRSLDVMLLVTLPLSVVLWLEGGTIIWVLLGQKWLTMVLPLKIFSLGSIFSGLVGILKPLFNALGKPKISFYINLILLIFLLLGVLLGVHWGLNGVAVASVVAWFLVMVFSVYQARSVLLLGKDKFKATFISFFLATIFTGLLGLFGKLYFANHYNLILVFVWAIILGVIYLTSLFSFSWYLKEGPFFTGKLVWQSLFNKKDFKV
jgi:O-antigen/teichoic acid export membrane protein